ncbi:riboflavin synthase [Chitinivorax tropicus]|uniref:Riboflavin synthase n=1 Tax=Chitinivorax tropicus TaxID=714531 RepID=A0A840MV23_9PROT|nr:riboflavin synthase [Chitinivorax tropicus]MBB5020173.1 riboflavin synthase [Chitinivorax tropicus]
MFTGIIQALGTIHGATPQRGDLRLEIHAPGMDFSDVKLGDSIAVNGVCLTAIEQDSESFVVDVSRESLDCTVGLDQVGLVVNLEKAMRPIDRLGGHLVSGHVDGVGEVVRFEQVGDCYELVVRAPADLARYFAAKGSATINGVSLTTNRVEGDCFSINLIPHTLQETNLKYLKAGSKVNLEVDLIARYCERLLSFRLTLDQA